MRAWLLRPLSPLASGVAFALLAVAAWVFVVAPLWRFCRPRVSSGRIREAVVAPFRSMTRLLSQNKLLAKWLAGAVGVFVVFALGLWTGWHTAGTSAFTWRIFVKYAAKLREQAIALAHLRSHVGEAPESSAFGITEVRTTETPGPDAENVTLGFGIKKQTTAAIDPNKVRILVKFYDAVNDRDIKLTNADVSYEWLTAKHDWKAANPEILSVNYLRPVTRISSPSSSTPEKRRYLGYEIFVYYNEKLQAAQAEPARLLQVFPPSVRISPTAAPIESSPPPHVTPSVSAEIADTPIPLTLDDFMNTIGPGPLLIDRAPVATPAATPTSSSESSSVAPARDSPKSVSSFSRTDLTPEEQALLDQGAYVAIYAPTEHSGHSMSKSSQPGDGKDAKPAVLFVFGTEDAEPARKEGESMAASHYSRPLAEQFLYLQGWDKYHDRFFTRCYVQEGLNAYDKAKSAAETPTPTPSPPTPASNVPKSARCENGHAFTTQKYRENLKCTAVNLCDR
jgi:hypothetical protein